MSGFKRKIQIQNIEFIHYEYVVTQVQSNSVITNSRGPWKYVRYKRERWYREPAITDYPSNYVVTFNVVHIIKSKNICVVDIFIAGT